MQVEVEYVEQQYEPGMNCEMFRVATLTTHDDGRTTRFLRLFPTWAVAARMAEYGVSQAQAVRILLAEPYIADRPSTPEIFADPLWRRGALEHVAKVERVVAEAGFNPLDARVEDVPADPTALMRQHTVPAELVEEIRLRHADARAAWRAARNAETLESGLSRPDRPAPQTDSPATVTPLPH